MGDAPHVVVNGILYLPATDVLTFANWIADNWLNKAISDADFRDEVCKRATGVLARLEAPR